MEKYMKQFVFLTGALGAMTGASLELPALTKLLMPLENSGLLMVLYGFIATFLGVMLVFCSRDLTHRGVLVIWEGILRISLAIIIVGYWLFSSVTVYLLLGGLFDLTVGILYLLWLPKHLCVSLIDLIFDRQAV